jgi:hypothetical protein
VRAVLNLAPVRLLCTTRFLVAALTTQPSVVLTKADIEFLHRQGREDEAASGKWLMRNGGGLVSLKIQVPRHSKKLFHFLTWVKKNEAVIVFEDDMARCNDAGEIMTTAHVSTGCLPSSSER